MVVLSKCQISTESSMMKLFCFTSKLSLRIIHFRSNPIPTSQTSLIRPVRSMDLMHWFVLEPQAVPRERGRLFNV